MLRMQVLPMPFRAPRAGSWRLSRVPLGGGASTSRAGTAGECRPPHAAWQRIRSWVSPGGLKPASPPACRKESYAPTTLLLPACVPLLCCSCCWYCGQQMALPLLLLLLLLLLPHPAAAPTAAPGAGAAGAQQATCRSYVHANDGAVPYIGSLLSRSTSLPIAALRGGEHLLPSWKSTGVSSPGDSGTLSVVRCVSGSCNRLLLMHV
jgi:hypothetical protein